MRKSASTLDFSKRAQASAAKQLLPEENGVRKIMDGPEAQDFQAAHKRFMSSVGTELPWSAVSSPPQESVLPYTDIDALPKDDGLLDELVSKVVILKLNGGAGSQMGCTNTPKSAIEVRSGLTFLDFTVRQVEFLNTKHGADVPLVLMNSFRTDAETQRVLRKYKEHNLNIYTFQQSAYPLIYKDSLLPIATKRQGINTEREWYPPGHGDVYSSFVRSGLLEEFIAKGKEYVFISNVDNLGATVDLKILYYLMVRRIEFGMEVVKRTRADTSGGAFIHYGGRPHLLERAQVPLKHIDEFKLLRNFPLFNTNNIWVNLEKLKQQVVCGSIRLPVIPWTRQNPDDGTEFIGFSTKAGAAISAFKNTSVIESPRMRFVPVKTTSDLLIVQSNVYVIKHGSVQQNPERVSGPPLVKLGPRFASMKDYNTRFNGDTPDMMQLDHLTVSGDVHFGRNVKLQGTVIVVANDGNRIDIPDGSVLNNCVVSGNLRIVEH